MQHRSGFTLIELSIVLVIIGLIVGGVFVGKDLIEVANIRATVTEYQKLDVAVTTFQNKYNCLPGDCPNASDFGFTPPAGYNWINGDGNGHIDNYLSVPGHEDLGEPQYLFAELSQAGLIGGDDPPFPAQHGPLVPGSNYPTYNGWWIYYVPIIGTSPGLQVSSIPSHAFAMMSGIYNVYPGFITPTTSYQIDSKIDDGMPTTGAVQVGFSYVGGQSGGTDQQGYQTGNPQIYCANYPYEQVPQYAIANNYFSCSLFLRASF
jgi:prepilin-type N-terminal cleavage/methylation domain-containing protein